jgi:signal transduction histidine kinase/CheY-like chemotaxis protein
MNLRHKTLLIIGVSLVVLTALVSLLASGVILKSFARYEKQEMHEDTERAFYAITTEQKYLEQLTRDWASWDETYAYIEEPTQEYVDEHMGSDMDIGEPGDYFQDIKMQLFAFVRSDGHIVFARTYDREVEHITAPSPGLQEALNTPNPLYEHPDPPHSTRGILMTPEQIWMVAAHPILTSDKQGPARGTVIIGRLLDPHKVAELAAKTNLSLQIRRFDDPSKTPEMQEVRSNLLAQTDAPVPVTTRLIDNETIGGYTMFYDVGGQPAIIIEVQNKRTIYAQGVTSVRYLVGLVALGGLLIGWAMLRILQDSVVLRLTRISNQVRQIAEHNNLDQRIAVRGRDELGTLANDINGMLEALEQSQAALRVSEAEAHEARQVAEQANQMKSRFLANMSHELRTPLNSIINFTRILAAGMRGPVSEEQLDYLNRVHASGEHLLNLINDILDLSKIEAGRMELHRELCQFGPLIHSTMSTATGLIRDKPIELHQEIAPDLPLVNIDKTRIRQVLLNLLSNAAKFTEAGSITVRVEAAPPGLVVHVSDTGIGISPEKLDLIFEEFRQADEGSERGYEGTGLGLAICRRLIEMHGGTISVASTPGEGTTFSFSLPAVGKRGPRPPKATREPVKKEGIPVLVIDDDPAVVDIVASYLETDGYIVYGVSNSHMAITEARRIVPAVIILDILMPYKDGWEVLTELKACPDLQAIPVIIYTILEENRLGLQLGTSAYLTKPIDEARLRATVARLVVDGAKILVVDDDPDVLEMVTHELQRQSNFTVITASGGKEGLQQVATHPPDLIILDLMMPEVDGFAVLEHLEQDDGASTIPVVVLTAMQPDEEEQRYLDRRVNSFLSKSEIAPEHLLSKVNMLLATHHQNAGKRSSGGIYMANHIARQKETCYDGTDEGKQDGKNSYSARRSPCAGD